MSKNGCNSADILHATAKKWMRLLCRYAHLKTAQSVLCSKTGLIQRRIQRKNLTKCIVPSDKNASVHGTHPHLRSDTHIHTDDVGEKEAELTSGRHCYLCRTCPKKVRNNKKKAQLSQNDVAFQSKKSAVPSERTILACSGLSPCTDENFNPPFRHTHPSRTCAPITGTQERKKKCRPLRFIRQEYAGCTGICDTRCTFPYENPVSAVLRSAAALPCSPRLVGSFPKTLEK